MVKIMDIVTIIIIIMSNTCDINRININFRGYG